MRLQESAKVAGRSTILYQLYIILDERQYHLDEQNRLGNKYFVNNIEAKDSSLRSE